MTGSLAVCTIGFTKTSARKFFERLRSSGVRKLIDVRLHNSSQLSGFAKGADLEYFLPEILGIEYSHAPLLAPTDDMLSAYKKEKGDWPTYEKRFLGLLEERRVESRLSRETLDGACLLCSEATPHHCHRRLVCDYLNAKWDNALIVRHLKRLWPAHMPGADLEFARRAIPAFAGTTTVFSCPGTSAASGCG